MRGLLLLSHPVSDRNIVGEPHSNARDFRGLDALDTHIRWHTTVTAVMSMILSLTTTARGSVSLRERGISKDNERTSFFRAPTTCLE